MLKTLGKIATSRLISSSKYDQKINTMLCEMREFLRANKGKHVANEEIINVFKKTFPNSNLKITNTRTQKAITDFNLFTPSASTSTKIAEDLSKINTLEVTVNAKSPMDKIKKLLSIKNQKKDFYVTKKTTKSLLHELTHIAQLEQKPTPLAYQRSLKTAVPQNDIDNWMFYCNFNSNWAYNNRVYKEEFFFNENKFIKKLMNEFKAPYYMKDKDNIIAIMLKNLIREAQAEKQAYDLSKYHQLLYKHPKLAKNPLINAYFEKIAQRDGKCFAFEQKINVMKEEYFNLIQKMRAENAQKLAQNV